MQWIDDSARDVLVAEKIAKVGNFVNLKPNSGGLFFLKNSAIYYNFLAILFKLAVNKNIFFIFYCFLQSLSLLAGFGIGFLIGGWYLGLFCLSILSFDGRLIFMQQSIYQRYIPASNSLFIILFSMFLINKFSLKKLILIQFIFIFLLLFHHSLLSFLPIFILISANRLFSHLSNKSYFLRLASIFIFAFMTIFIWLILSGNNLHSIFNGSILEFERNFIYHQSILLNFLKFLRGIYVKKVINLIIILLVIFIPILLIIKNKYVKVYGVYLYSLIFVYLISFLFKNEGLSEIHYLEHYRVLMIMFVPIFLFSIATLFKKSFFKNVFLVSIFLWTLFAISTNKNKIVSHEYEYIEELFEKIQIDASLSSTNNWIILDQSDWGGVGWFSPAFWFFLDDSVKRNLIVLDKEGNNLLYLYSNKLDTIYLFCHHLFDDNEISLYDYSLNFANQKCFNNFLESEDIKYKKILDQLALQEYTLQSLSNLSNIFPKSSVLKIIIK